MEGQLTGTTATQQISPQQQVTLPQSAPLPPQPPTGALPGGLNPGAIKVLAILLLILVVLKYLLSFFWNPIIAIAFNNIGFQAVLATELLYELPLPLIMTLTGFAGLSFARKLRRHGAVGGWLSGCSLADIIVGFASLASSLFTVLIISITFLESYLAAELSMTIAEVVNLRGIVSLSSLIIFTVGLLAAAIILFIKAGASRQMIQRSDLLSVVSAALIVFNILLFFVADMIIIPNLVAVFTSAGNYSDIRMIFGISNAITSLSVSAYFALRAIFWLTSTKKVISLMKQP